MLCAIYSACLGIKYNPNFGAEFSSANWYILIGIQTYYLRRVLLSICLGSTGLFPEVPTWKFLTINILQAWWFRPRFSLAGGYNWHLAEYQFTYIMHSSKLYSNCLKTLSIYPKMPKYN